jgi:hypothetical protein
MDEHADETLGAVDRRSDRGGTERRKPSRLGAREVSVVWVEGTKLAVKRRFATAASTAGCAPAI